MASMDADHMTLRTELPELTQVPITASNPAIEMHRRPGHHRHDTDDELVKRNSRSSDEKVYPDEKAAFSDEKNDAYITTTDEEYDHTIAYDVRSGLPLPDIPGAPEEGSELTFRAVIIGSGLGAIVGVSGRPLSPPLHGADRRLLNDRLPTSISVSRPAGPSPRVSSAPSSGSPS